MPVDWRKGQKFAFLDKVVTAADVEWETVEPDKKYNWVTSDLDAGFNDLLPIGSKAAKQSASNSAVFRTYTNGVKSNSDSYVFSFDGDALLKRAEAMVENYNGELARWRKKGRPKNIDAFLKVDEATLKWIRHTKRELLRDRDISFDENRVRRCLYRPFAEQFYYFDSVFSEDTYQFPHFFPHAESEAENVVLIVPGAGARTPFWSFASNRIAICR